jgi:hypothetical protein
MVSVELHRHTAVSPTLLADVLAIFDVKEADRLPTAVLAPALGLGAKTLAKAMREHGLEPRVLRIGEATPRGYRRQDVEEALSRGAASDSLSATADPIGDDSRQELVGAVLAKTLSASPSDSAAFVDLLDEIGREGEPAVRALLSEMRPTMRFFPAGMLKALRSVRDRPDPRAAVTSTCLPDGWQSDERTRR